MGTMKKAKKATKAAAKSTKRASARRPVRAAKKAPAKKRVQAVPAGYQTVTPHLTIKGAARAIDFYKRAFGAKERGRMPGPDGESVMHAELLIGSSIVFLADEFPGMGGRSPQSLGGATGSLHLYVANVDQAFARAVAAGAEVRMPVADMFWGDRYAKVADPFGHEWGLASHKEDLSAKQIGERAQAFFARMAGGEPGGSGSAGTGSASAGAGGGA
jgi:uncharacterized glyoxalase superfamily protein PhnB